MNQVDFDYVGKHRMTIYITCFQNILNFRDYLLSEKETKLLGELTAKTETIFIFLVEEGNKRGYDVNSILEIPDSTGFTCFSYASQFSRKISDYIIGKGIKLNSINTGMMVPDFKYPDLAIPMMEKGINPNVITYSGDSQMDLNPSSFESEEAKKLLAQFQRSIHFSIEDIIVYQHSKDFIPKMVNLLK